MAVYFILYCAICEMVIEWFFLCNWRAYMRRLILFFFRGICAFSVLDIFFHCLILLGSFSWMVSRSNIYVFLVSSSNCSGKWWIYGYIFWISIKDLKVVLSGPPIVYVLHIFFFCKTSFEILVVSFGFSARSTFVKRDLWSRFVGAWPSGM